MTRSRVLSRVRLLVHSLSEETGVTSPGDCVGPVDLVDYPYLGAVLARAEDEARALAREALDQGLVGVAEALYRLARAARLARKGVGVLCGRDFLRLPERALEGCGRRRVRGVDS